MWIATHRESSNLWTHTALSDIRVGRYVSLSVSIFYASVKHCCEYRSIAFLKAKQLGTSNLYEYRLNLSILISRGKETKKDFHSSGEWNEIGPILNRTLGFEMWDGVNSKGLTMNELISDQYYFIRMPKRVKVPSLFIVAELELIQRVVLLDSAIWIWEINFFQG